MGSCFSIPASKKHLAHGCNRANRYRYLTSPQGQHHYIHEMMLCENSITIYWMLTRQNDLITLQLLDISAHPDKRIMELILGRELIIPLCNSLQVHMLHAHIKVKMQEKDMLISTRQIGPCIFFITDHGLFIKNSGGYQSVFALEIGY